MSRSGYRVRRAVPLVFAALAGSTVLVVTAAYGSTHSATASETLVVNYAVPPQSLDPASDCSIEDISLMSNLYVTLLKYAPKAGAVPGTTQEDPTRFQGVLARSWTVTDGGKTLTFKLRPSKFPSGRPVDAKAVKYSFERAIEQGGCGQYFMTAAQGPQIYKSITAVDPTTLVIKLSRAEPLVLHTLTQANTGIVDPELIEAHGGIQKNRPNQWLASHYAGSGAYEVESYDPGRQLVLKANPDFVGPNAKTPRIIVNFVTSDATLLLQARAGRADVTIGLTKKSVASLRNNPCCQVIATPAAAWQLIALPNQVPPFDNAKLRQALTYAVPYQQILDRVAFGYGQLFYGPYPPAFPQFNKAIERPRSFDPKKAAALLKASGVSTPVNVELVIREGVNDQEQIATIVQNTWRDLGVNVRIRKLSAAEYQNAISAQKKTYAIIRFDGPSVPDPAWLLDYDMRCTSIFNTSNYCNKKAEALLDKVHPTVNREARQAVWNQIARIWVGDSPRIPVYAESSTIVMKKGVKGYRFAQDDLFFNLWSK